MEPGAAEPGRPDKVSPPAQGKDALIFPSQRIRPSPATAQRTCRRAHGTNFVETVRVTVHANCRLRRIYFAERLYGEEELPPEFKLYLPIQRH